MQFLEISKTQFAALQLDASTRFELRLAAFLEKHAAFKNGNSDHGRARLRGHITTARRIGLASEHDVVLFSYACILSDVDATEVDETLTRDLSLCPSVDARISLLRKRIVAYAASLG